ncbi:hypothetical protein [Oceanispirochaeta sp. M1]|uniref:hypothetical protein n=2 Tax=Oceanispirochaeta TaxID=2035349 RepID=UPI000E08F7D4|nr:hypothetical protein [Oceanispirochaeta sp. M1]RDG29898.1 hypothetical protein DV872_19615 [Oceanispirochaeta sp. M1]
MSNPDYKNQKSPFENRVDDLISRMTLKEKGGGTVPGTLVQAGIHNPPASEEGHKKRGCCKSKIAAALFLVHNPFLNILMLNL